MKKVFLNLMLFVAVLITGCQGDKLVQTYQSTDEREVVLFSKPMQNSIDYRGVNRNPVIFVHGLLGANIVDAESQKNLWGNFTISDYLSNEKLNKLAIGMEYKIPLNELKSNSVATTLLEKSEVKFADNSIFKGSLDNYDLAIYELQDLGYVREGDVQEGEVPSLFTFAYDWRRDISENSRKLKKFIDEKEAFLQKEYKEKYGVPSEDIKFDLIGHSMGGLVIRYLLQYGDTAMPNDTNKLPEPSDSGVKYVEKVIIVGTPSAGYVDTVYELVNGLQLMPRTPVFPAQFIGTFSSYYFMMPHSKGNHVVFRDSNKAIDIYDINTWIGLNWGLANSGDEADKVLQVLLPEVRDRLERRKIALDHLDKNLKKAKQFKNALEVPLKKRDDLLIYLFAGDSMPSNRTLIIDDQTGRIVKTITEAGDGKITAVSTRFDLRDWDSKKTFLDSPIPWDGIYYLGVSHMGFFKSTNFFTNLSSVLFYFGTERQKKLENIKNN